ncbi:helix-turn-helix transcriptional regulator [Mycobacterium heidelbergense]|uniref:Transcriptional regulator n=2 Tax=Mycobacterium heidelbergense TaxID=53376 RepID=A0A1X0DNQ5_MYCHE|nr:helix-turn-helix transcriptional regulator [Mycobacterium heidelbergense]MCV7049588.1 helix-turn-helix transcriptional regulator [Mycobacterium heidelbergense]ORA73995.1 transcriptional regulator [Mycobacterium heidelbergense]
MSLSCHDLRRHRMTRRVLRGFSAQQFANARRHRGLSVSDLARLADVGQSTIHAWEAGTRTPQVDLLARVMEILKTPIEQVVIISPDERYPGDWRVIKGVTQPQLAAAAKIATTTLRGIERADIALTDANAFTLAMLLDLPVEQYRAAYQRARKRPPGISV